MVAEDVLANNSGGDDGLDKRLPNPGMFDHVLVRARIDGKTYWLDGTLPPVAGPGATPAIAYRWVLPPTEAGSALQHLEWRMTSKPNEITLYAINARDGFDKLAQVPNVSTVRRLPRAARQ